MNETNQNLGEHPEGNEDWIKNQGDPPSDTPFWIDGDSVIHPPLFVSSEAKTTTPDFSFTLSNEDTNTYKDRHPVHTDNKYFTPSIEDIRVGYECEISPTKVEIWKPLVWTEADFKKYFNFKLRVPYLTKEQIEAEGWEAARETPTQHFRKNVVTKGNIKREVEMFFLEGWMELSYDCGEFLPMYIYMGECKDINTFRYICKLLGI